MDDDVYQTVSLEVAGRSEDAVMFHEAGIGLTLPDGSHQSMRAPSVEAAEEFVDAINNNSVGIEAVVIVRHIFQAEWGAVGTEHKD